MSNDYYVVSGDSLRDVADKIREKGGTSAQLEFPDGWMNAIDDIETDSGSIGNVWQDANGLVHLDSEASGGDEVPDDGKTRIWIHIAEETPDNRLTFYLRFIASVANNTTVDWGDGTVETLGSTTAINYSHKYAEGGDYIITLTVNNGTITFEGDNSNSIYGASDMDHAYNRPRLKRIIFGDDVTSVGGYACYNCYGLTSVTIPDSVTSIGANAIRACYGLTSVTIPDGVTSIGENAFYYCLGMSEYHFKPTTPPTLGNTNVFYYIRSDCIIYVPQGSLSAYQQATNWSQFSSYIQEEPQS